MSQYRDEYGRLQQRETPPVHTDADGRAIPLKQLESLRRQIAQRAANDSAFNKREAEAAKTELQRRVELFERQAANARARGDNKMAEIYENQLPAVRAARQEELRQQNFDADPRVQATLRTRQQLLDGGHKDFAGAWDTDISTAIATVESRHNYNSVELYLTALNDLMQKIGRDSLIHRQQVATDAQTALAEAGVKASAAQAAAKEAELRLVGGPDAGP